MRRSRLPTCAWPSTRSANRWASTTSPSSSPTWPWEQEHAWENLGITVSQIIKEGGNSDGNDLDLLFSGRKTMSGIPIKSSVNADQTRVDFLDLSHWGRAVLKDIDFYEVNGNTVFPIYGASGGLAASYIFYFDTAFQVWDDSPRTGAFIDTLARPSGY